MLIFDSDSCIGYSEHLLGSLYSLHDSLGIPRTRKIYTRSNQHWSPLPVLTGPGLDTESAGANHILSPQDGD